MQSQIRVLLADDSESVRKSIRRVIQKNPEIQVIGEARNGLETLQLVRELKPDLAIIDISMPDLDGIDVAERLRTSLNPIHILMLSAYACKEFAQLVFDLGLDGYLLKEEAADCLADTICQIMLEGKVIISKKVMPLSDEIRQVAVFPCGEKI